MAPQENRIAAACRHTLHIDYLGQLWAFGENASGQIGIGTTTHSRQPTLVAGTGRLGGQRVVSVAASVIGRYSLAIDALGRLWAWGENDAGQLGDGTTTRRISPILINVGHDILNAQGYNYTVANPNRIVAIAAGGNNGAENFSLAIDYRGRLWSWGNNAHGRLGDGTTTRRLSPVQVNANYRMNNAPVVAIAAGTGDNVAHGMAIDYQGILWSWGSNSEGQLGVGAAFGVQRPVPSQVNISGRMGNARVVTIAAGGYLGLAIDEHGSLWSWGSGNNGRLGVNSTSRRNNPIQINTNGRMNDASAVAVAAARYSASAIDYRGRVWSWGIGGTVGDGSSSSRVSPVLINTGARMEGAVAIEITASYRSTFVIDYRGRLWSWGRNTEGSLGDGTTTTRLIPVRGNSANLSSVR